jgi:glycosyltransferase involved in cell wall biosynthesis
LERPDVLTVQDPFESGLAGVKLAKLLKVPLHVQLHTDIFAPGFTRSSLLNSLRVHIAPYVLRRASRVRTVSKRVAERIVQKFALKMPVTALPIFVDADRFANAAVSETLRARFSVFAKKILFVGRLEQEKNPCLALRAFAAAAADACLIFVGEGSELSLLQKLAKQLRVENRVFFEGFTDPAPYYKLADLMLAPSRYEGYGLAIVEALAAGTPVLATDVGIAREAGALISEATKFPKALAQWLINGPTKAPLKLQTYPSMDAYVLVYCEDIMRASQR